MERHPNRSWGIILQQAWSMFLKDKMSHSNKSQNNGNLGFSGTPGEAGKSGQGSYGKKKLCIPFNAGYCKYGAKCKFDHRCGLCNKFGHGSHNCRKAAQIAQQHSQGEQGKTDKKA